MQADAAPFPALWWAPQLEDAGLGAVRPNVGTYGAYDYALLPELPFALDGRWRWLRGRSRYQRSILLGRRAPRQRTELEQAAQRLGLTLPASFVDFLHRPRLAHSVRTCTDMHYHLDSAPVALPERQGWLVRFLSDSQSFPWWYLYLPPDGADYCVVSGQSDWFAEWPEENPTTLDSLWFCAPTFEEFMGRIWIEHELWFASVYGEPLLPECVEYVRRYRERAGLPPE